jgi:thioredoxin 1
MPRRITAVFLLLVLAFLGSNAQQPGASLPAADFADRVKHLPGAPVVDVRTPGEFANGHLAAALNYDWNGGQFDSQVAALDKSKPVFVYCMSGKRSAAAAARMRTLGFREVYEMQGGMIAWRAAGLPETGNTTAGMTRGEFDKILAAHPTVLVDFYAEWCVPCQKMKPYLEEIRKEQQGKVEVLRINADENPSLCRELKIDALPVLHVYKKSRLSWNHSGYIGKPEVVQQLK